MKIRRHTEGDSRVAKELPSIKAFQNANKDHIRDVTGLINVFVDILNEKSSMHDWTKVTEPYESMFYRDLCNTIKGSINFDEGEWADLHYNKLERHHLKRRCPDDVDLFDVIEMICDCVAAGLARSGDVYDIDIPAEILTKAVNNTVEILKNEIEVVD